MKKNGNRGFAYYVSGGMLTAYNEKPLELRLAWLYAGNIFRQAYPVKLKKLQDAGREGGAKKP